MYSLSLVPWRYVYAKGRSHKLALILLIIFLLKEKEERMNSRKCSVFLEFSTSSKRKCKLEGGVKGQTEETLGKQCVEKEEKSCGALKKAV